MVAEDASSNTCAWEGRILRQKGHAMLVTNGWLIVWIFSIYIEYEGDALTANLE